MVRTCPLLVDAVRGDRLAVEVARRLGNSLAAPTIRGMLRAPHGICGDIYVAT